jgi:hypothetical protein
MRRVPQAAIFSFALAVSSLALAGPAAAGWQKTSWGMSAPDVRAMYPEAEVNLDRDNESGGQISTLTIRRYPVADCVYRVNFWFQKGGGLARVALFTEDGNRDGATRCYKSARSLLTGKYGEPAGEKTSRPTRQTQQLDVRWNDDDTNIGLHVADVPRARRAYVSIGYEPVKPPPSPAPAAAPVDPEEARKL